MSEAEASIHASAVKVGDFAVLIRGPSGAGKSRLAFDLIVAGLTGAVQRAVMVGDDRVYLRRVGERILVRPAPALAGLIEIRGLGIRRCDFVQHAPVGLVVDLSAADADRLPAPEALIAHLYGAELPRVPVAAGISPLPLVLAALITTKSSSSVKD
jgi:serine kinase of HPr protein (carbohydrate metabolism regulator)